MHSAILDLLFLSLNSLKSDLTLLLLMLCAMRQRAGLRRGAAVRREAVLLRALARPRGHCAASVVLCYTYIWAHRDGCINRRN